MDINKWKSCAVDIESYTLIRAMGKAGFMRPGSMIAKLVDEEVRKIALAIMNLLSISNDKNEIANMFYPNFDDWKWGEDEIKFAKTIWSIK